jgi:hypothetical protein
MRLSTHVPGHLMSVGTGDEHVGAGTRDHQVELYTKDTHGRGTVEVSLTRLSGGPATHMHLPVRVLHRYSWMTIVASTLIAAGVGSAVFAPFGTKQHVPWVCWPVDQALTVMGVLLAALGTAVLAGRAATRGE